LRKTLAHLEQKRAAHHFIRVRKSATVNGAYISEIRPMFDGVYDIVLAEGTVVKMVEAAATTEPSINSRREKYEDIISSPCDTAVFLTTLKLWSHAP